MEMIVGKKEENSQVFIQQKQSFKKQESGMPSIKGSNMLGRYPAWIEQTIANIVSKVGYLDTLNMARDVDVLDQKHLMRMLNTKIKNVNKSEGYER